MIQDGSISPLLIQAPLSPVAEDACMFPTKSEQPLLESPLFSCFTENGKNSPLCPTKVLLTHSGRSQVRFMTLAIDEGNFLAVSTAFLISAVDDQQFTTWQGAEEVI